MPHIGRYEILDRERSDSMSNNILTIMSILSALSLTTSVHAELVLEFTNITNNSIFAGDLGKQLTVAISPYSESSVLFTFKNAGPHSSIMSDIYFEDGSLLTFADLIDADDNGGDAGVDFSLGAAPRNLPAGNNIQFVTTIAVSADPPPGTLGNGVDPGESLGIIFNLQNSQSIEDVEAGLIANTLRIGIHVQGIGEHSDSFINVVPEPESLLLSIVALGFFFGHVFHKRN